MLLRVFILISLLMSSYSFAFSNCENGGYQCAPVGEWRFSVGLGAGVYTNPLHNSDNIPLVLIPQVSYYGESFFFHNNILGYSLIENNALVISAITLLNTEKSHFERWHPSNIFIPNASQDFIAEQPNEKVNPKSVKKRKWAVDAGIQLNWFASETMSMELTLVHDVSNVYKGLNGNARINQLIELNANSFIDIGVGLQWNSSALVDYYYGINLNDSLNPKDYFEGKSSIHPYLNLGYSYKVSEKWTFQAFAKRKKLNENTFLSPLVKDKYVDLMFMGFFYEF